MTLRFRRAFDLCLLGGEDAAQELAASRLRRDPRLCRAEHRARRCSASALACKVLGRGFTTGTGIRHPRIGLLDLAAGPRRCRSVGEIVVRPGGDPGR
ncbi:hypothetical protein [Amycolatopsis sp. La24]|uniref:hypothetical protein n=1 Tax=Amycolatopsis sp. La24 TaxID=3028304 RepID=UPI0023B12ECF|nr:hypothetical protein [Amycolatopsis sp. La24]